MTPLLTPLLNLAPQDETIIKEEKMNNLVPQEVIAQKIFLIRGKKVMLDRYLAELYGVTTKRLNEQVKRNKKRFPEDFMFQLTKEEVELLRSQFATLKGRGQHSKYLPYAFTEQGVAMLSSVLNSERAIEVNIQIIRVFTKLREVLATHSELRRKVEQHDKQIKTIFTALNQLLEPPRKSDKEIGFQTD